MMPKLGHRGCNVGAPGTKTPSPQNAPRNLAPRGIGIVCPKADRGCGVAAGSGVGVTGNSTGPPVGIGYGAVGDTRSGTGVGGSEFGVGEGPTGSVGSPLANCTPTNTILPIATTRPIEAANRTLDQLRLVIVVYSRLKFTQCQCAPESPTPVKAFPRDLRITLCEQSASLVERLDLEVLFERVSGY